MRQLWFESGYKKRMSILMGLGSCIEEAKELARLSYDSLAHGLRETLEDEYAHTGDVD